MSLHTATLAQQQSGLRPAKACPRANIGEVERLISTAAGAGLTIYGLSRGSVGGVVTALLGGSLVYRGVTGHCQMYDALGINTTGHQRNFATAVANKAGVKVEKSITIRRSAEDLYTFWRNFENLPRFMSHLDSVTEVDRQRSHWVAKAPLGATVAWDAEIIFDRENEMLSWRSIPGSGIENAGSVHFHPTPDGRTEVIVALKYNPPAGKLGVAIASLLGEEPAQQIQEDLQRFKHMMETGERNTAQDSAITRKAK